ncbi:hypothetical protein [Methanimicrococcus hongohii]|nr:hypothetical protein [Methanimicrococcus sp. Hf6]
MLLLRREVFVSTWSQVSVSACRSGLRLPAAAAAAREPLQF